MGIESINRNSPNLVRRAFSGVRGKCAGGRCYTNSHDYLQAKERLRKKEIEQQSLSRLKLKALSED